MRKAFLNDICNQNGCLSSEGPEENSTLFNKAALYSAATTLGHPCREHRDLFDEIHEGS